MTRSCRRINVCDAHGPSSFSCDIVRLVGEATACEINRGAISSSGADAKPNSIKGVIPRDTGESLFTSASTHWISEPSHLAQFNTGSIAKPRNVTQYRMIKCRSTIHFKQFQSGGTQMNSIQSPVMEPGYSERATIAHAFVQYLPRSLWSATNIDGDARHLTEMIGFGMADAVWRQAHPRFWVPEATRHWRIKFLRSTRGRDG
ncbi:unannotated protein [freshwater metagenome]|uniref:Unannotated protein n=1 Tax=freshwater metagenome TaxID=449393 RepID=A0A6J7S615_9ZZZZ